LPAVEAAELAIAHVERLKGEIGIPLRIRDIGGTADQLASFAEKAFAIRRLFWVNPREATQEDVVGIYQDAL